MSVTPRVQKKNSNPKVWWALSMQFGARLTLKIREIWQITMLKIFYVGTITKKAYAPLLPFPESVE